MLAVISSTGPIGKLGGGAADEEALVVVVAGEVVDPVRRAESESASELSEYVSLEWDGQMTVHWLMPDPLGTGRS